MDQAANRANGLNTVSDVPFVEGALISRDVMYGTLEKGRRR